MKNILFLLSILTILPACSFKSQDASTLLYEIEGKEVAYPRLSADGNRILYQTNKDGRWQLWIMDIPGNTHTPVMVDAFNNNFPDWSYDNEWIAFTSDRDGNEEIYLMRHDGSELKRITHDPGRDIHPYFSPDGRYLLINSTRINGSFDIFRYTIATGELKQLSQSPDNETCARYSTDMTHMVYLRNGETSDDIFLADSLNTNPVNISGTPGVRDGWPVFSHDNTWVYYSSMDTGNYCVYRVRKDGTEKVKLTDARSDDEDARVSPSRDGKRIIFNRRHGGTLGLRELLIST